MKPKFDSQYFRSRVLTNTGFIVLTFLLIVFALAAFGPVSAQGPTDGAFNGVIKDMDSGSPISGAKVVFRNRDTGLEVTATTGSDGTFSKTALPPGEYDIEVSAPGYIGSTKVQKLYAMDYYRVVPVPFNLTKVKETVAVNPPPGAPVPPGQPAPLPPPAPVPQPAPTSATNGGNSEETEKLSLSTRTSGTFDDRQVSALPLGGRTLTRTFDDLSLLLPGVTLPPFTIGNGSGPGQGAGVGSAGQFSVNGMRSRSNNFTVDGSDNNDADIGVRRQGFFSLVPQPIESIQEFQVTTLLAPAQYGRNFGGQVNAVSKSGGNQFHGTFFGFINSSQLNARDPFDTANGNAPVQLRSESGQSALDCTGIPLSLLDLSGFRNQCENRNTTLSTTNQSGGEDSFTLGQGGFVLGGPIKKDRAFFFVSYEAQVINATKEASFAVPTIDQRGIFRTGASGFFADCLTPESSAFTVANCNAENSSHFFPEFGFPSSLNGDAVFSLYPFANNPSGIFGPNTFTENLPASALGNVASGKYDQNFTLLGKPMALTARYNFTQDKRVIPVTGNALFSALRPRVRTQNFSTIVNTEINSRVSNVLRLSYGRTRLAFDEVRDPFLIPSQISPDSPFLLNAPRRLNRTFNPQPILGGSFGATGVPNISAVLYQTSGTTECGVDCANGSGFGRVGQINVSGFSSIGVDVNNFPQNRVNNTYQIADFISYQIGKHSLAFGEDIRRVELNSDLPRNSRTVLNYIGTPELDFSDPLNPVPTGNVITGTDLVAAGIPTGASLSLLRSGSSAIGLRYYEFNFFGQDTWRPTPNLSINFGLRYEYNTPPKEMNGGIESTFSDPLLDNPNVSGLKMFVAGRTRIFEPDKNNFEPRVGVAWSPNWFGNGRSTVIRGGFGVYHDQILGSVVSQSRNVFPNFITINASGFNVLDPGLNLNFLTFFNPAAGGINFNGVFNPFVQSGTLNNLNPALPIELVLDCVGSNGTGMCSNSFPNSLSITLPARKLDIPSSEQYSLTFEQQLTSNMTISAAYIGTRGHNLLRVSTPNLGPNNLLVAGSSYAGVDDSRCFPVLTANCPFSSLAPRIRGAAGSPGGIQAINNRPIANAGAVYIYETGGGSHYDAFQVQVRGRFARSLDYQAAYTLSRSEDDASDVFDLAGSSALPQNSLTRAGELAPSNFDSRHRFSYYFLYDLPMDTFHGVYKEIFGNMTIAGSGYFQSGQPFTVNSLYDINIDGNLTDRLNSTQGIVITGDRGHPLVLSPNTDFSSLRAPVGQDGAVARNSFRSGNILNLDLAVIKNFLVHEDQRIVFRMDIFNFINRANYGIPVRFLEAPGFGQATDTVTPGRRIQFGLKYIF